MPDFPELETERLVLRRFIAQDIIDFYLEQDGKSHNRWLVERKADHRPIGTCGFHKWARGRCLHTDTMLHSMD